MTRIALALDLGGTNLRLAAVGEDGTVYCRERSTTPRQSSSNEIVDLIVRLAERCRAGIPSDSNVFAMAAAIPATIDDSAGVLKKLPNLPALEGVPLRDILAEKLGIPVILENDANAAALGEHWLGASRAVDDSICITLGTGVGGGIILGRRPFRGKDGTAGEVGHICVESGGLPCGCGGRGCLEQYASASSVIRLARELGIEAESSYDVWKAATAGNADALEVFRRMGMFLGVGLSSLINLLNPEMIVIGGGLAAAWDLFIGHALGEVNYRAFRLPAERVNIVRAQLGDDAGILGAARSAFTKE